jgi:hypothetical protein
MWQTMRSAALALLLGVKALLAQSGARDARTRAELLVELAAAERLASVPTADGAAKLAFGKLLYQAGDFVRARELLRQLAEPAGAPAEAIELAAKLESLTGRYAAADAWYDRLIAARAGTPSGQVMAKIGKMFTHYQRNQFAAIAALEFPAGVQLPNVTLAKTFQEPPYRLEWSGDRRVSEVPFYALDPLPQLAIEVNGVPMGVLFDTGGDILIIDDEVAKALGVTSVANVKGSFGGGLEAPIGFGKVDRVKVGQVTLHQVPVMILASKRFTFDPKYPISGVFGTALMRQFLGTIDYRNQKIVLRERTAAQAQAVRRELAGRLAAEIPFVLDATHIMNARGSLNGKDDLTYFIDSGLAMEAVGAFPPQTLQYLGIPMPKLEIQKGGVGGGGGQFPSGFFPIRSISLGPLRQDGVRGEIGARPADSYWERGYITDGLISHRFLKRYGSWTLDFDSMTYLFEK